MVTLVMKEITKIFLKYGEKIKSSKQLANIIDDTFFCM